MKDGDAREIDTNRVEQLNIGKKVYITQQAIDKVRLVNIPGHTDEENKYIQNQHKELLKKAMIENDSNEFAFVSKGKDDKNLLKLEEHNME
ncbi:hypothetical protein [Staphylococcus pseudintermedius]|uniref:hypothetical protein n=1 Tax=Staphylococcus pseudintermedius TaxID=283734 RepID=UPI0013EF8A08